MNKQIFAQILFPISTNDFTYSVPAHFKNKIQIGIRVLAPFGKSKISAGIIIAITDKKPDFKTKKINSLLDENPILFPQNIKFWQWIAQYYLSTLGEIMKAALPVLLKLENESKIYAPNNYTELKLSPQEKFIVGFVAKNKFLSFEKLIKSLKLQSNIQSINHLLQQKKLQLDDESKKSYKPLVKKFITINPVYNNNESLNKAFEQLNKAPKQKLCLEQYFILCEDAQQTEISKKELLIQSNNSISALNALIKKNIFIEIEKNISRITINEKNISPPKELNPHQQKALQLIKSNFLEQKVCLLHGVTSSGKTEIYIHLIKENIEQDKQVLYLLPEIGLTNQIIERLHSHFGDSVAVYHSGLSNSERYEIWQDLLNTPNNRFKIILGVRSSIFLPFNNLGLIIVDEEHEASYKQTDPAPRYHARDAAIVLAKIQQANILLGSATPSIESYFNAKTGKYALIELLHRHKGFSLPKIEIINMNFKTNQNIQSSLSKPLVKSIDKALNEHEQVILFRNRRGFSPILQCNECGEIPKCKNCDVSLTYHKNSNVLVCHYCGYSTPNTGQCKKCHSHNLKMLGAGTQRIEEDLQQSFQQANIARMDIDSMQRKNAYSKLINDFEQQRVQILIGTQIISKGLDFENVNLVGIINADTLINMPDYKSQERAFQLLTQVSGRAGRHSGKGKVLLQTRAPKHPVIKQVQNSGYQSFIKNELNERKLFFYPPFSRMIKITLTYKNSEELSKTANTLTIILKQKFINNQVLGPITPYISKIKNNYRMQILLKFTKDKNLNKNKELLQNIILQHKKQNFGVKISIEVDP